MSMQAQKETKTTRDDHSKAMMVDGSRVKRNLKSLNKLEEVIRRDHSQLWRELQDKIAECRRLYRQACQKESWENNRTHGLLVEASSLQSKLNEVALQHKVYVYQLSECHVWRPD